MSLLHTPSVMLVLTVAVSREAGIRPLSNNGAITRGHGAHATAQGSRLVPSSCS